MKQDLLAKVEKAQRLLDEVAEELRNEEPTAETRGGDDRKPPPGSGGP